MNPRGDAQQVLCKCRKGCVHCLAISRPYHPHPKLLQRHFDFLEYFIKIADTALDPQGSAVGTKTKADLNNLFQNRISGIY